MEKTIIAIGGAGFYNTDLVLEKYILAQSGKENPLILFVPTASGDSPQYITYFYDVFNQLSCKPSHLSLFNPPKHMPLEEYILSHDIIYVGGGNTKNLLALWREWKLDEIMRKAWEKGIILSGSSAGSLCWFEQGVTDSLPGRLSVLNGLGFLPGSNCPHYNDESERRPSYQRFVATQQIKPGVAQDQRVALHYRGTKIYKIVSNKNNQNAYWVEKTEDSFAEKVLNSEKID